MRYLALLALLLVLIAMPTPAYAETIEWDADVTKGIVGHDGIACIATATQGGHTVKYRNYVGADAGTMATDPGREKRQQEWMCNYMVNMDLPMMFKWYWNIDLDPKNIKVSIERL